MERHQKIEKINIKKSDQDDESFLMSLRNNKKLLKSNFKAKPVTKTEHHLWFKNLLDRNYSYTIYSGLAKAGHIRFEKIRPDVFVIGIALLPEYQGRNIAGEALKLALVDLKLKEGKVEVIAEVRGDNLLAQKFFLKSGFNLNFLSYKLNL